MDCTSKLLKAVSDFFTQYGFERTYWVGYSGGLDSCVLLACCYYLRQTFPIKLKAVYINHGLSPNAADWAAHCQSVCDELQMDFQAVSVNLYLEAGDSLEEKARHARYHAFADLMAADDMLLTAHHQDDQAETLLLQLFRGAGTKGLSAMPSVKHFKQGYQGRPLLAFSRVELEGYAREQGLTWIEDESNTDATFSRNFLRNEVLPLLKGHWPGATKSISRSAAHCAEAQNLLEEFAKEALLAMAGTKPDTLSVSKLSELSLERRHLLLRTWIDQLGFSLPDTKKLASICTSVLMAAKDRFPCVRWGDVEVRRYQDDLYLLPAFNPHDVLMSKEWDFKEELSITSHQKLVAVLTQVGLSIVIDKVQVRFRRGGEVIKLPGRGTHTLKNLFQEWRVPTWERDRVPLLFFQGKLVVVVGYAIDADYLANDNKGWQIKLCNF